MKNTKAALFASSLQNGLIWVVLDLFRGVVTISCDSRDKPRHRSRWRKWELFDRNATSLRFLKIAVTFVTFVTNLKTTVYQFVNKTDVVTVVCFCVTIVTNLVAATVVTIVTVFLKAFVRTAFSRLFTCHYSWQSALPPPMIFGFT